jgi:hypothetical protein
MDVVSAEVERASGGELAAYLKGAAHDGTFNRQHRTFRICQRERAWPLVLVQVLNQLGQRAWIYEEGSRGVFVVETCFDLAAATIDSEDERRAYARGYFDAEGGIPRDPKARFYIQLVQKDLEDLRELRAILDRMGIACGKLHNPSVRVDPDYWRFFVRASSRRRFAERIGSWHPRKRELLETRFGPLTIGGANPRGDLHVVCAWRP